MFSNRRISVKVGRTLNDGNYGSYQVSTIFEADVAEDVDIKEAYQEAYKEALASLQRDLANLVDQV